MSIRTLLAACGVLVLICALPVAGTAAMPGTWVPYGLNGYDVIALAQQDGYLYAAVHSSPRSGQNDAHGVWRRNQHPDSSWVQLGLEGIGVSSIWVRPDDPMIIYAAVRSTIGSPQAGGHLLFRTTDGGETWSPLEPGPDAILSRSVVGVPTSPTTMIISAGSFGYNNLSIYRSEDAGATWSTTGEDGATVLVYDPTDAHAVWTTFNSTFETNHIFRSPDDGQTWAEQFSGVAGTGPVGLPAIAPTGRVYVAYESTILSSDDDGATWDVSPVFSGVSNSLHDVDVSPGSPNLVLSAQYPATVSGVWLSGDAGVTWTNVGGTLPDSLTFPDIMASATEPGVFYLAVEGWDRPNLYAGVWRYEAEPVVSTPETSVAHGGAARLTLHANPAARSAVFALSVLESGVRSPLRILDGAGRLVAEIDAWRSTPGGVEAAWDGRSVDGTRVAHGVYFGTVETMRGEATTRFVWLE